MCTKGDECLRRIDRLSVIKSVKSDYRLPSTFVLIDKNGQRMGRGEEEEVGGEVGSSIRFVGAARLPTVDNWLSLWTNAFDSPIRD